MPLGVDFVTFLKTPKLSKTNLKNIGVNNYHLHKYFLKN